MSKNTRSPWIVPVVSLVALLAPAIISGDAKAEVGKRCTVEYAMAAVAASDPMAVCSCDVVTLGLVRYLQNRPEFGDILEQTAQQCQALATVLSETPTANVRGPQRENEERPDGDGRTPTVATRSEPPPPPPPSPPLPPPPPPPDPDGCPC